MTAHETTSRQDTAHGSTPADRATGDGGAVPVACALSQAGLAAQAARWVRLAARAMTRRTQTDDGLRISFRAEPGAEEELRALAAVENECCPWATWTVRASPGRIVLDVRSSGDGVTALHSMFTGNPGTAIDPGQN